MLAIETKPLRDRLPPAFVAGSEIPFQSGQAFFAKARKRIRKDFSSATIAGIAPLRRKSAVFPENRTEKFHFFSEESVSEALDEPSVSDTAAEFSFPFSGAIVFSAAAAASASFFL